MVAWPGKVRVFLRLGYSGHSRFYGLWNSCPLLKNLPPEARKYCYPGAAFLERQSKNKQLTGLWQCISLVRR